MSGFKSGMRRMIGRARDRRQGGLPAPTAGAEGSAGPAAPMGSLALQDERKKRMGRNRGTIMQDKLGG
jgi:hypothetical protein